MQVSSSLHHHQQPSSKIIIIFQNHHRPRKNKNNSNSLPMNKMNVELAKLSAMRYQERNGYRIQEYLHTLRHDDGGSTRSKMAIWYLQICDVCKFHRETASIAMSYLDRFLATGITAATTASTATNTAAATPAAPVAAMARIDLETFQLAAMTCLYTAVKVHEPTAMDPSFMAKLSREEYTAKQVVDMELAILQALEWRLNPPTPLSFCRQLLAIIPDTDLKSAAAAATTETVAATNTSTTTASDSSSASIRNAVYDLAKYQTELVLAESSLVGTACASTVAFCAIMNALESLGTSVVDEKTLARISYHLATAIEINCEDPALTKVQTFLYGRTVPPPTTTTTRTTSTPANVNGDNTAAGTNAVSTTLQQNAAGGTVVMMDEEGTTGDEKCHRHHHLQTNKATRRIASAVAVAASTAATAAAAKEISPCSPISVDCAPSR